ncbi:hypothetical protein LJC08_00570 [Methanimicrococcus sp. OttesenSCG-928-J09]|nr:hypothetical protein [Methanimicrococcus sp. OttesenSCG-928-J09]
MINNKSKPRFRPRSVLVAGWNQFSVTTWSQILVLQWEGSLYLKSLRDFCGLRRCNDSPATAHARKSHIF